MNILIIKNIKENELKKYQELFFRLRISYTIVTSKEAALNILEKQLSINDIESEEIIEGIILDPDITKFNDEKSYYTKAGLDIITYLQENNMKIPVIINSDLIFDNEINYPYIYGKLGKEYNSKVLEHFLEYIFSLE